LRPFVWTIFSTYKNLSVVVGLGAREKNYQKLTIFALFIISKGQKRAKLNYEHILINIYLKSQTYTDCHGTLKSSILIGSNFDQLKLSLKFEFSKKLSLMTT
jgi:hypothetical protein